MFKSKSLIKTFTEGKYATLLERPPAGDLSINQLQKLLFRQMPMAPNRHTIQLLCHYFTHRDYFLKLSDAHLKFMNYANSSTLICPKPLQKPKSLK